MSKKLILYLSFILLCEIGVYFWSAQTSDLMTIKFQLAARYSARLSMILFSGLLLWIAIDGLKVIFQNEEKKKYLVLLIAMIVFNHLIHFGYLCTNYYINDISLITIRTFGGVIGYTILSMVPFYLWKQKQITVANYWLTLSALFLFDLFFILSYIGRWKKDLPMTSPKELYMTLLGVALVILLLNVYRIFSELKVGFESTRND